MTDKARQAALAQQHWLDRWQMGDAGKAETEAVLRAVQTLLSELSD